MSGGPSWLDVALSRRSFLIGSTAWCTALSLAPRLDASTLRALSRQGDPFSLGVASGDPWPDSVVLWTRLAPQPLEGGGMPPAAVEVRWEIAEDQRFRRVVQRGRQWALPEWGHSVHVEATGLQPARWYWYRFMVGADTSPVGRTRTMPAANSTVERLAFAFASCQHYETGLYTAYSHLEQEDISLVFFLGDYIYEGPGRDEFVRKHHGLEINTLADYRNRYAQYKLDPRLQGAHAAFPWIVTWDDHEVDNNYAGDVQTEGHPKDVFLLRRAAAYQAYYEHMPLRAAAVPRGPWASLYRGFSCGSLADFSVLDTRQYRTDQPCGDGIKVPCDEALSSERTVLGADQETWLHTRLRQSKARWNIIPQQIMMGRVNQFGSGPARYSMDQWPGYEADRQALLRVFADNRPSNPVILSGDIHSSWVNNLQVNSQDERSPIVATEFVGTSISSDGDGTAVPNRIKTVLANNPFVQFYNGQRGYVTCDLTPDRLTVRYQGVDFVTKPGAPLATRATFVVEDGKAGANRD